MCTISWLHTPSGYQVYFNRDEAKLRPRGQSPRQFQQGGVGAVMPIDPQGQGTWFAVNDRGLTFALLNYYQGRWPKGHLISRGQIVKTCAHYSSLSDAVNFIESLPLHKYAPFSLLCFSPEHREAHVPMLRWTGKSLESKPQECPLFSSAYRFDEVTQSRTAVYRKLMSEVGAEEGLEDAHLALHASHQPNRSAYSVCMHRDDAQTVSFSHVRVDADQVRFHYADGPPCEVSAGEVISMARV